MKTVVAILIVLTIIVVAGMFLVALSKKGRWRNIFSDKKRDLKLVNPREKAL